jgi:hypothetical protein
VAWKSGVRLSIENGDLLHQQHLTGAFDRPIQAPLVVRGKAGIFAREDAPLVSDELAQQVGVLEVQRIHGEIDLGLRTRCADFAGA